jgi:hypothetical protein
MTEKVDITIKIRRLKTQIEIPIKPDFTKDDYKKWLSTALERLARKKTFSEQIAPKIDAFWTWKVTGEGGVYPDWGYIDVK